MGREMRRRENKKNKKLIEKREVELDTSVSGLTVLKVVGAIVIILLVLYFILAIFVTKELDITNNGDNATSETETTGVSNKILASNIFDQKEETYYVYFYDFTDEEETIASAISGTSDMKIYRVDTSSSLNRKYVTEDTGNASATSLEDLQVKNPTFIQVSADKITAYYEGSTQIIEFLTNS